MGVTRSEHVAALLPNGKVLVEGGLNGSTFLSTAELYDVGLGFQSAWQPVLTSATSPLLPGSALTASGTQFNARSFESRADIAVHYTNTIVANTLRDSTSAPTTSWQAPDRSSVICGK